MTYNVWYAIKPNQTKQNQTKPINSSINLIPQKLASSQRLQLNGSQVFTCYSLGMETIDFLKIELLVIESVFYFFKHFYENSLWE